MNYPDNSNIDIRPNKQALTPKHKYTIKEIVYGLDLFDDKKYKAYVTDDDRYYYYKSIDMETLYHDYLDTVILPDMIPLDHILDNIKFELDRSDSEETIKLCYTKFICLVSNNYHVNRYIAEFYKTYQIAQALEWWDER